MNATTVPSKATIQGSFRAASTTRTYLTYQKQFFLFCQEVLAVDPASAGPSACTDFFHHLYGQGKTARTVDSAKTALVAYFRDLKVDPNPARDVESKQYVVGLQKYNKKNNIDDEKKAHPLSVHELSCLVNSLSTSHHFVGAMYRFLLSASYLGCFRISEMLNLTWDDVAIKNDGDSQYVSIRLRWHKKASVQSDCQIYHLVDEKSFPCLRVCGLFGDYVNFVKRASPNLATKSFVFPAYTIEANGTPKLNCVSRAVPVAAAAKSQRQTTLDVFVSHVIVPTARSAQDAWNQWFTGDPHVGLFQPLRSFNRQMIRADRRKYSERLTLSLAFS
ncbi:hypothetical protein DYB25_014190, partial [Aphanomyces astaci]